MKSNKNALIIGVTFLIGCIICGLSYFLIPLFASLINGTPYYLGIIIAALVVAAAVFSMVLIKKKRVNFAIFFIAAAAAVGIYFEQRERFWYHSYKDGYISDLNAVYNRFGTKILSNNSYHKGFLKGHGLVWYSITSSAHRSHIKIYSLDGTFLTEEYGEYHEGSDNLRERIGLTYIKD